MDKRHNKGIYSPEHLNPEIRRRLEAAVLDIFSKTDFHRASIRAVAKKSGISFTTIYKYYGSKEGLVFGFIDNSLSKLSERVTDHLQGMEDVKEKLRKVFWLQLDYYERNPGVGRILFLTVPYEKWMADKTYKQKKMFDIFLDVIRQGQNEGILNPHVRAGTLIDLMYGFIHRHFTMWLYRGRKESLVGNNNVLFEMLWRGISNPE